ncbi:transposable element Tcb1 transposase [Trichonephila clavipes]|nr:transposable element Tcb1 transposase [Trichonephila clavipes]
MLPRRNNEKFQQRTEFEWGRIIGLREGGFSYRVIGARVHSGTVPQIPLTANHRRLRLQWAHEHRAWKADWHQVIFSDESRFNLWDHDGRIRVKRYAGECCLPEGVIERDNGLTRGVMVWGAISYDGRSNLLRIEGTLNSNR